MNYLKCVCTTERKKPDTIPERLDFSTILECSHAGCMLEFSDNRPRIQKAKIGKRLFAFCSEYCYNEWLLNGYYI